MFHSTPLEIEDIDIVYKRRTDIISTRVYIFLLVALLCAFVVYRSQAPIPKAVTIEKPSYENYLNLSDQYRQSLSCPCTKISYRYDQFIQLKVARFHEVCRSVYVTPAWIFFIADSNGSREASFTTDFRVTGIPFFQVLASFCNLVRTTIDDELIRFNAQHFVTSHMLLLNSFENQSQALIQSFVASITSTFMRSIQLMRATTQGNSLISSHETGSRFSFNVNDGRDIFFQTIFHNFGSASSPCFCKQTPTCVHESIIYKSHIFPLIIQFKVPGIMLGCYTVEALFQSNLICFYNQSCIDDLRHALNSTMALNTTALDPTMPSRYEPNTTIDDIIAQLMVEQWTNTTSYKDYYAQCHPETCTYTYTGKNNWLVVVTATIGVFGGLARILKIVVPRLVKLFRSFNRNRVAPVANG